MADNSAAASSRRSRSRHGDPDTQHRLHTLLLPSSISDLASLTPAFSGACTSRISDRYGALTLPIASDGAPDDALYIELRAAVLRQPCTNVVPDDAVLALDVRI